MQIEWRDIEKAYPESKSQDVCRDDHERQSRFNPWPLYYPLPRNDLNNNGTSTELASRVEVFDNAYEPLIDALVKLPYLHKLSFAESVDKVGFNQVRQQSISSHANKCAAPVQQNSKAQGKRNKKARLDSIDEPARRADAFVLFGLLFNSQLSFTSLRIETELPFVYQVIGMLKQNPRDLPVQAIDTLANLTDLQLQLDCGWRKPQQRAFYNVLLQTASPNLKRLRMVFVPNAAVRKAKVEDTISTILSGVHFARLESLEFELVEAPQGTCLATTRTTRHLRPTCQYFDLAYFLFCHQSTLNSIKFRNVLFVHHDEADPLSKYRGPEATTKNVLDHLQLYPGQLKHMEWTVNHFKHDRRCRSKHTDELELRDCQKLGCGVYMLTGTAFSTCQEFEEMAEGINVPLDNETRTWEFGQYVMGALHMSSSGLSDGCRTKGPSGDVQMHLLF